MPRIATRTTDPPRTAARRAFSRLPSWRPGLRRIRHAGASGLHIAPRLQAAPTPAHRRRLGTKWEPRALARPVHSSIPLTCARVYLEKYGPNLVVGIRMHGWGSRGRRFKSGRPDGFSNACRPNWERNSPKWEWSWLVGLGRAAECRSSALRATAGHATRQGRPRQPPALRGRHLAGSAEAPVTTPFVLNPGALICGANPGSAITDDYASPFNFTGTIHSVDRRCQRGADPRRRSRTAGAHGPPIAGGTGQRHAAAPRRVHVPASAGEVTWCGGPAGQG
jgi:hypothetical protein